MGSGGTGRLTPLNREVIFILAIDALRDPEDDGGKHEGDVLRYVRVSVVCVLFGVVVEDVFEDQNGLNIDNAAIRR